MSFGVTLEGFVTKRLADIISETETKWKEAFGDGFDLDPRTPEGQIKNILDERESLLWELAKDVYDCGTVGGSEGVCLDNVVALTGQTREGARATVIDKGRAFGTFGTVVPAGTIISKVGDATARFSTNNDATISNAAIDEVQTISFSNDPDDGSFQIIFPEGTTAAIAHDANLAAIQAAVDAVVGAGNCVVSGSIDDSTGLTLTYAGTLAGQDRAEVTITGNTLNLSATATTVTPATTTEGSLAFSNDIVLTAEETGSLAAPAGTVSVIETPVVGLDAFTNLEDGIPGRSIEEDADLKLRRQQEL